MYRGWWFACTAIPILAATLGPLANVLSIGALVTSWRVDLIDPANPAGDLLPGMSFSSVSSAPKRAATLGGEDYGQSVLITYLLFGSDQSISPVALLFDYSGKIA